MLKPTRISGVTCPMCHRLSGPSTYGLNGREQAHREPQPRGPENHYRLALSQHHYVCAEIEGGNVGRGVPSPCD